MKFSFNLKFITFWEKKYSINRNNIPKFFDSLTEKILLTGKYLNAINETGRHLQPIANDANKENEFEININKPFNSKLCIPNAKEIFFTIKEDVYKQMVESSYNFSSRVLLDLLLNEHKLIDRLRYMN